MSEPEFIEATEEFPAAYLRFLPAVTFGLRAAALAGLAVTAGVTAAHGLSGVFDSPMAVLAGGDSSTCC